MDNYDELVKQLRNKTERLYDETTYLWKCADAIESLQKENIRLTELKDWLFAECNRFFAAMDKLKL